MFRRYNRIKNKKYDVKIYKLCDLKGYTYANYVYTGKNGCLQGISTEEMAHNTHKRNSITSDW